MSMKLYTPETLPTEPGLYQSNAQVWELDDEGMWGEIHGDGGEFGDHPLIHLVPEVPAGEGKLHILKARDLVNPDYRARYDVEVYRDTISRLLAVIDGRATETPEGT